MTTSLPTDVIKKQIPSFCEFNLLIDQIFDKNKICHLFIVNKTMLFNQIYTTIFEKEKVINPTLRSIFQLMDAINLNDKSLLNSYNFTYKTHSTILK